MFYGVAYYPEHWPEATWAQDAQLMAECHFDGVRIGEFAWCRLEPEEGHFDLAWLDRAIQTLAAEGLRVILGTPTAAPPVWLIHQHPEILPVDAQGVRMSFGVRKHYCHTIPTYRRYALRIVEQLAKHYQDNPNIYGWQIDNEFGDHDTVRCYCDACRQAFINWLQQKYSSLDELNRAWGTIFWGQEYHAWEHIPLPAPRRPIGLNPSHLLDYYRFASDQVIEFARMQANALRARIAPSQRITTNIIPTYWEINFAQLASSLDFVGWDCYTMIDATSPIRYPANAPPPPLDLPPRMAMVSMVHDMMRSLKQRPFWVLETLGQDRLVAYHTLAHGGEGVVFFRWRWPRFGAEQARGGYEYHGIRSPRYIEGQQLGAEIKRLAPRIAATSFKSSVGLLYSFDMGWAYDIAHVYPRSTWVDGPGYWRLLEHYYTHLWRHNVPVQMLTPGDDLTLYPVVIAPCLHLVNDDIIEQLCTYVEQGGLLIVGPESGAKDWNNVYIETLPPAGKLRDLFGCALIGEDGWWSLQPSAIRMDNEAPFAAGIEFPGVTPLSLTNLFGSVQPCEKLHAENALILARFVESGAGAATWNQYKQGCAIYLGWTPGAEFFDAMIAWLENQGKLFKVLDTSPGVQATLREGNGQRLIFIINHNFEPASVELDQPYLELVSNTVVKGTLRLAAQAVAILSPLPHIYKETGNST